MFEKIIHYILFAFLLFVFVGCGNTESNLYKNDKNTIDVYKETLSSQKYIIHALGGDEIGGVKYDYINSVEILKKWYQKGFRLFEVDVYETSDGALVLSHRTAKDGTLSKKDCQRLGLNYPANPNYEEFMQCTVYGIYKTSSFNDLVRFMEEDGTDIFVMIDIQDRNYEDTKRLYQKMYNISKGNKQILNRFIAGGHTSEMIRACKVVYNFPLLNLYWASENDREFSEKDFVEYCKTNFVTSFSTSTDRFMDNNYPVQLVQNLISYVFTTDNFTNAQMYFNLGATIVGTNILQE